MAYNIRQALECADKSGFTIALKWETKRYIVALTHNEWDVSIEKLEEQVYSNESLDNINLGGWVDSEDNTPYVDISTSTDDLSFAETLGKFYNQIAIWDNVELKEIRL
jgi:hypothetical protein